MTVLSTVVCSRKTSIPGLLIFDITSVDDQRGWFQEKFHYSKLVSAGLPKEFSIVQNSLSYNKDIGVTRGFHAEPWDKYISVVTGSVFCAYVDLREGATFGAVVTTEIDSTKAVYLPRGVANSFQTLEEHTYYLYSVNEHWSAESYDDYVFVNLGDPVIDVRWPIPLTRAVISDRDRRHPTLAEVAPISLAES